MSYVAPALPLIASWELTPNYSAPALPLVADWSSVVARIQAPSPLGAPAVLGEVLSALVVGQIALASPLQSPALTAQCPIVARAALSSPLAVAAVSATVVRYELRGVVRAQGVLVNRLVRAYRRDTGALVGEGATVAGAFRLHVGFEPREHYVIPVHMDDGALDFAPPCANRVLSVLAMDEVAA